MKYVLLFLVATTYIYQLSAADEQEAFRLYAKSVAPSNYNLVFAGNDLEEHFAIYAKNTLPLVNGWAKFMLKTGGKDQLRDVTKIKGYIMIEDDGEPTYDFCLKDKSLHIPARSIRRQFQSNPEDIINNIKAFDQNNHFDDAFLKFLKNAMSVDVCDELS